jgi:hypothetical protein
MHTSESAQLSTCIECGAEVWAERDRAYSVTADDVLCYACALRRGGVYSEPEDRWVKVPDLTGLRVEA